MKHLTLEEAAKATGPIAWMARNSVASNLLMLVFLVGGFLMLGRVKQEVFPEFDLDMVIVNVPYPGASPAEVEQGVNLALEEAVRGLDGIKRVTSTAAEGMAAMTVELLLGTNPDRALSDVQNAVNRIASFPQEIERPVVALATTRRDVISLVIYGDLDEHSLRSLAEQMRDELLENDRITLVELSGLRPLEIAIEVPQKNLRSYNLTLGDIAQRIQAASVELPSGGVKTQKGEVLLRTAERRKTGSEFADVVLLSRPDGTAVTVGDIAGIRDEFAETDEEAYFDGKRAAMIEVFRVGDQTPIEVADIVKKFAADKQEHLPPGVGIATWGDRSQMFRDRIDLLRRNAILGLALVLLSLGLFLEPKLAFWVTLGIPISFLGSMLMLPSLDVSINMISLFAFIVTLGIVVDDAIVVGEAIYKRREDGMAFLPAAISGAREVMAPVTFAVLTSVIAFMPLLFVPGIMGKFFRNIPVVVIAVLLVSLVESLFVLPAHLAHSRGEKRSGKLAAFYHQHQRFGDFMDQWVTRRFGPFVQAAVKRRYLTLSVALAVLVTAFGVVSGGWIRFTFMPRIESDRVSATLTMPFGTSIDETRRYAERILAGAHATLEKKRVPGDIHKGIFSQVGQVSGRGRGGSGSSGSHLARVQVYLVPSDEREMTATEFTKLWRETVGEVPGAESLTFKSNIGPGASAAINLDLSHTDMHVLEHAADRVAAKLREFNGVREVENGFSPGKEQLDFQLTDQARALGLTEIELARQTRHAFYGAQAARQQRGRNEIRAYVRLPKNERLTEYNIEELLLRTPRGGEIPLAQAAGVTRGRAYTAIRRQEGRRVVTVTGDIIPGQANANEVVHTMATEVLPQILAETPGLKYEPGGDQRHQAEALGPLFSGFTMALMAMFALLAVAFRSYVQPIIVMGAIPFGFVGALIGHLLLGFNFSFVSIMGIVALSGIVVNDSLILVMAINEFRASGLATSEAVLAGALRRFRPVILTSLTTFMGLAPMILEPSVQARFLIPMALSLGFGVLFATVITLILVPTGYLIMDDAHQFSERIRAWSRGETTPVPSNRGYE